MPEASSMKYTLPNRNAESSLKIVKVVYGRTNSPFVVLVAYISTLLESVVLPTGLLSEGRFGLLTTVDRVFLKPSSRGS